jgi:hydrophobic/amphiphilic exporter-1 (mainly G- bacteria), HAE1 family
VIYLAMSSPTLPLSAVDDYAENLLAERISMVNGVAQVNVFGSQQYAVRIQVDPNKLAAYGLGIDTGRAGGRSGQREPAARHALRQTSGVHRAGQRPA